MGDAVAAASDDAAARGCDDLIVCGRLRMADVSAGTISTSAAMRHRRFPADRFSFYRFLCFQIVLGAMISSRGDRDNT